MVFTNTYLFLKIEIFIFTISLSSSCTSLEQEEFLHPVGLINSRKPPTINNLIKKKSFPECNKQWTVKGLGKLLDSVASLAITILLELKQTGLT